MVSYKDAVLYNPDFGMTEHLLNPPLYENLMQTLEALDKGDNKHGNEEPVSNTGYDYIFSFQSKTSTYH